MIRSPSVPNRRRREHLHWVVVLDGHVILGVDANRRLAKAFAALPRLSTAPPSPPRTVPLPALPLEIGDVRLLLVLDAYERSRKARDLERLGHDQCHRLAIETHVLVVERTERRAGRGDLVAVFLRRRGKPRPVLCVNTSITPATASASAVWIRLSDPWRWGRDHAPCADRPGYSAAYLASPVTLARPSTRLIGLPIWLVAMLVLTSSTRLSACDCGFPSAASSRPGRSPGGPARS